jgi:hypothetical protein
MMVLNMVSDGKLAVDDAVQLLSVLTRLEAEDSTPVENDVEVVTIEPEAVPLDETAAVTDAPAEQMEPPGQQLPASGWGLWTRFKQFVSSIG